MRRGKRARAGGAAAAMRKREMGTDGAAAAAAHFVPEGGLLLHFATMPIPS